MVRFWMKSSETLRLQLPEANGSNITREHRVDSSVKICNKIYQLRVLKEPKLYIYQQSIVASIKLIET